MTLSLCFTRRGNAAVFSMVFVLAALGGCSSDEAANDGQDVDVASETTSSGSGSSSTDVSGSTPTDGTSTENSATPGTTATSDATTDMTSNTNDGSPGAGGTGGMPGAGSNDLGNGGGGGISNSSGDPVGAGGSGGDGTGSGGSGGDGTGSGGSGGGEGGSGGSGSDGMDDEGSGAGGADGMGGDAGGGDDDGESMTDPLSPGCGTPITRPDRNQQQTMEIGGATRYYLLDVPQNADNQTPLSLIFGLHGFDMNNVAVKDLYNFTQRSNGQAITVMPQGEGPPPGDVSHWGDGVLESTWVPNQANFDYLQALITTLGESYCIDRSRVFIVGFSMGAFFTNAIACEHSDWFRAFAPIAGGGPTGCADGVEAAIMIQHGTEDPIVELSSGQQSRDTWVEQNGCSQSSSSSFTGCESYDGCPDGKPVVWCTGSYDHYIPEDVVANIWSFFSQL